MKNANGATNTLTHDGAAPKQIKSDLRRRFLSNAIYLRFREPSALFK
jgi:hypothetical protein